MSSQPQRVSADPVKVKPGETVNINVDFTLFGLAPSELLTGTPVVTPPTTNPFTISNKTVNQSTFINRRKRTVAVGKGVQFNVVVAANAADADYDVDIGCDTNAAPAQHLIGNCPIQVRSKD